MKLKKVHVMFIRLIKSPTQQYTLVYLSESYRDEAGKPKHRHLKCYGKLEELQTQDPDILAKLRAEARGMASTNAQSIALNLNIANDQGSADLNYGYFFLEAIFRSLKLPEAIRRLNDDAARTSRWTDALQLLTYARIVQPDSKAATHAGQAQFFNPFHLSLDDVYSSLDWLAEHKEKLELHLHKEVCRQYGRDQSLVFYDVTNYYFETEREDELRKKGVSKEYRPEPIIQMGLLMDRAGLPIAYKLFPGNTNDMSTLAPFANTVRQAYHLQRFVLTADRGLNTGKNLHLLVSQGNGYLVSQKIRNSTDEFIAQILDESDYRSNPNHTFKIKSFLRDRILKDEQGQSLTLTEKVVCFWSAEFDAREKHKREGLEEMLEEFLKNPAKYKASNRFGAKKYLKQEHVNQETGEVQDDRTVLLFQKEKYERDVALDGYYVLVTSETQMSDEAIIEQYRGLWRIEESFHVLKSDLEGRPVFVRTPSHIEGHFFACFLALLLSRILEFKLQYRYDPDRIQEALQSASCRLLADGVLSLSRTTPCFKAIARTFAADLDRAYVKIEQLRQFRQSLLS
jgi:transposase